jgi:ketosteroid isomerase-like protein
MAFIGPFEDRMLIRERYGAYGDAVFRADIDGYLACWAEGGVRISRGSELIGKDALRAHWAETWNYLEKMTFFTEIGAIEADGDHAAGRCYCREILMLKGGALRKVVGVYDDALVRDGGVWLFARREYQLFMDEAV